MAGGADGREVLTNGVSDPGAGEIDGAESVEESVHGGDGSLGARRHGGTVEEGLNGLKSGRWDQERGGNPPGKIRQAGHLPTLRRMRGFMGEPQKQKAGSSREPAVGIVLGWARIAARTRGYFFSSFSILEATRMFLSPSFFTFPLAMTLMTLLQTFLWNALLTSLASST